MQNTYERVTAVIPPHLRDELERSARANDRSMSAELRRALTEYLGRDDREPAQTNEEDRWALEPRSA